MKLRPYQQDVKGAVREVFAGRRPHNAQVIRSPVRRVLLVMPTGAGKTVSVADMFAGIEAVGQCGAVLVHRRELKQQVNDALELVGCRQSRAWMLAEFLNHVRKHGCRFAFVAIDEAHHATAPTYQAIMEACPGAYVLGVTATPQRLDGRGLGDVFDAMVVGPSTRWLIDHGHLSTYRMRSLPEQIDTTGLRKKGGDYDRHELAERAKQLVGCEVDHYRRFAHGTRAVAFCVSVEHAELVAQKFRSSGFEFACLHGGLSDRERDDMVARFRSGRLTGLATCDIISEGFDLPAIETAIMLRNTKSLGLYLQQVGRALRLFPGKQFARIHDHAGLVYVDGHGMPCDHREWSLESVPKRSGQRQKQEMRLTTCPKCFTINQAGSAVCSGCGAGRTVHARKMETLAGDLEEVTAGKLSERAKKANPFVVMQGSRDMKEAIARLKQAGLDHRAAFIFFRRNRR